jgi:hypothetical protein
MKLFLRFLFLAILVMAFPVTSMALGEGGETPQIALSVAQASPGATIEIAGGRFEPDIGVKFILVQNGTEIELGTILCDDHGEFNTAVLLPDDLQVGDYEVRGMDEKNRIATAPLIIVSDGSGQEQEGQRSEEDLLLAPMPTVAAGAPTPQLASDTPTENLPKEQRSVPYAWIIAGIGIVVVSILVLKFKR